MVVSKVSSPRADSATRATRRSQLPSVTNRTRRVPPVVGGALLEHRVDLGGPLADGRDDLAVPVGPVGGEGVEGLHPLPVLPVAEAAEAR